eukprot:CAMPEP_0174694350 /NCGR_PEP_ID=MMETSP1094-20130205/980_1 /TAXON_ID=156173 /ORGANISM="Chrysochromulina brevifilum, Strain UTEX LB 985" /LENGTH=93 /DNA_ID=CAMNT_0015890583 /DNA_START=79 /DNA_END=359 /DNA_ORIENTATION=+
MPLVASQSHPAQLTSPGLRVSQLTAPIALSAGPPATLAYPFRCTCLWMCMAREYDAHVSSRPSDHGPSPVPQHQPDAFDSKDAFHIQRLSPHP